jgi:competence CoiA-like predicted nuclease
MESFGAFAIEFQLSGTFQTEISARCKNYEYAGIPLLWILFGMDTSADVQQSFHDVIRRHRGNAFVLDPSACPEGR